MRERIADIPLLASIFSTRCCDESGGRSPSFTDDALAALQRYSWPGNVRELQNVIERAVLLGKGGQVRLEDLPRQIVGSTPVTIEPVGTRTLETGPRRPRAADHSRSARSQSLESASDGRRAGYQSHHAL